MSVEANRESAILEAALQIRAHEERAAYLDKACAGDPGLRQRVETTLRAQAPATESFEEPPLITPEPPPIFPHDVPVAASKPARQRRVSAMAIVAVATVLITGFALVLLKTMTHRKARPAVVQQVNPAPPEVEPPPVAPPPAASRDLVAQGSAYGRNADWRRAFECFQRVVSVGGTNGWSEWEWSWATASALAAGETNACEAWCGKMLERFGRQENPDAAERCAKVCLALPGVSGALLERAAERADFTVALNPDNRYRQMAKAMAEYRRGNWSNALEWLRRPERSSQFDVAIQACGFAAMARHQLGDPAAARKSLDELNRRLKVMVHTGELGDTSWDGCARAVALRAEAERLILGREVSSPLNPVTMTGQRGKWQEVQQLLQSAERFARQGNWAQARDVYAQALAHPEFNWDPWEFRPNVVAQQMATTFLLAGDADRHRDLCRALLDRPQDYLPLTMRERNAWVYLIKMDHFPPDLKSRALATVRQTCQGAETENSSWIWLICGLTAYREGRYGDALSALDRAQFGGNDAATARLLLYRAMTCQQAGRADDAATALQDAEAAFAQTTPQSAGWWNTGFYQIALSEVRSLMGTPGKQPGNR
jgi:tetratricopeptide (TPR) repeat protein